MMKGKIYFICVAPVAILGGSPSRVRVGLANYATLNDGIPFAGNAAVRFQCLSNNHYVSALSTQK